MHHTSQLFSTNPYSVTMLPVYTRSHLVARNQNEMFRAQNEVWRVCLRHHRSVTALRIHAMNPLRQTFKYLYTSRALCASA